MAKLQYGLLAEYARVDAGGLLTVAGAGFDTIGVPFLPANVTVACATRVLLDESEKNALLSISIRPPQGVGLKLEQTLTPGPESRPHQGYVGLTSALNVNLTVQAVGVHRIIIALNGDDVQELSFNVVQEQPQGQADA